MRIKEEKQKKNKDEIDLAEVFDSTDEEDEKLTSGWKFPQKLKLKSRRLPDFSDNLLTHVTQKLKDGVKNITIPKRRKRNLTLLEAKGQRWCKKAIKERRLYITKVDKGGCILILDADEVAKIMEKTLNEEKNFKKLENDPRADIKKEIKNLVNNFGEKNLLLPDEVFAISGQTKKGGWSRGHEFVVKKPYMYPLFKLHKLSMDDIRRKKIPPTRMVTSGVGGPTYRLGVFLDSLLKPVVQQYCEGELIRDSTDFLIELKKMESSGISKRMNLIGTLDVDALYPSIKPDLAITALSDALHSVTAFANDQIDMILTLSRYCIENSVVQYRGKWFKLLVGLPTGGPESGSIANIVVYFVLEKILLIDPKICNLNLLLSRKRFLDDLFFGWLGDEGQFTHFTSILNEVGTKHGITFKGGVGKSVDFLDTTISLDISDGSLTTKLYVKPTDATRYLNRRSDHSPHTFISIPFSQFRRAAILCSDPSEKIECMDYIAEKLTNSGFKKEEIKAGKDRALKIDRNEVLSTNRNNVKTEANAVKQLTFLINRDSFMSREIKRIVKDCKSDIERLLGKDTRIIVAERKNCSIGSEVFAKSSFSSVAVDIKDTQECNKGHGCKSCKIMKLKENVTLWKNNDMYKRTVKLDFRCDCTTECAIYLYVCNICIDNDSFYLGQTTNSCQKRATGHRACFTKSNFKKSALSFHIYNDHPQYISKKLSNYSMGVIKSVSAVNLDRAEDYHVERFNADLSLNRYKVTSY